MKLGRVFRKMGLPMWTFLGIGLSSIWFQYVGALGERFVRVGLGITDQATGWVTWAPSVVMFLVPVVVLTLVAWVLSRRPAVGGGHSGWDRLAEGKRGLILLVSKAASANFAIEYHYRTKRTLERVWLLPSDASEVARFGDSSLPEAQKVVDACKALADPDRPLQVEIIKKGVSPGDAQDTFDQVNRIFRSGGLPAGDVIADFTGGTKPMSVGMIMACLPAERDLEYVAFKGQSFGPFVVDYQHSAFDLVG